MLIEIDRAASKFQLAHGWWAGLYWRAVVTDTDIAYRCRDVYLQVLIPARAGVRRLGCCVESVSAKHHGNRVSDVNVYRVSHGDGGGQHAWKFYWAEAHYGSQYYENYVNGNRWTAAEIHLAGYPGTVRGDDTGEEYVGVRPKTFLKFIVPSSQYLCEQFVLVEKLQNHRNSI